MTCISGSLLQGAEGADDAKKGTMGHTAGATQKEILVSSNLPKSKPNFWRISALASKMGQIKKWHIIMLIKDCLLTNI